MSHFLARLVIVGGGFTGATTAVQAVRRSPFPLDVIIVEPNAELGPGLPYRGGDPDHRVNGPLQTHSIDPFDTAHIQQWADQQGVLKNDPHAQCPTGTFIRRTDYGRYLHESVLQFSESNESGSSIKHLRARAVTLQSLDQGFLVQLQDGQALQADAIILAFGNPPARLPRMLEGLADPSRLLSSPLAGSELQSFIKSLGAQAHLAVMGTSLTAADVITTVLRQAPDIQVTAFSRRGLLPHRQRPPDLNPPALPKSWLIDRINAPIPSYLYPPEGESWTVRKLCRAMRRRIDEVVSQGHAWQQGFDEARDVVWQFWPKLSDYEKRRFIRRLRVWYDVARFRLPPQTAAALDQAVASGRLRFCAQTLKSVESTKEQGLRLHFEAKDKTITQTADALVNCTGFDLAGEIDPESFAGNLVKRGLLIRDGTGVGFRVDQDCQVIGPTGDSMSRLRLVGPATAGVFGDSLGAMFIAVQVHRMLPSLFQTLSHRLS
ncbi:MAG: FAD/NAD(P)-binding protein [Burkholderiaceae bacterium]|jgi:uncharacterized NAD(P)/FAD-binding protein YdhS